MVKEQILVRSHSQPNTFHHVFFGPQRGERAECVALVVFRVQCVQRLKAKVFIPSLDVQAQRYDHHTRLWLHLASTIALQETRPSAVFVVSPPKLFMVWHLTARTKRDGGS